MKLPAEDPTAMLSKFSATPDAWVKRDPRMVLLTGLHPYNVEPPLGLLHEVRSMLHSVVRYVILADRQLLILSSAYVDARALQLGPITPPALHYVRNHGAPPDLKWEEHTLTVTIGDVEKVFTMDEILSMEAFTQVSSSREAGADFVTLLSLTQTSARHPRLRREPPQGAEHGDAHHRLQLGRCRLRHFALERTSALHRPARRRGQRGGYLGRALRDGRR